MIVVDDDEAESEAEKESLVSSKVKFAYHQRWHGSPDRSQFWDWYAVVQLKTGL